MWARYLPCIGLLFKHLHKQGEAAFLISEGISIADSVTPVNDSTSFNESQRA